MTRATSEPVGWQPIETAPKNGLIVFVTDFKNGCFAMVWDNLYKNQLFPNIIGMWVAPDGSFTWNTSNGFGPSHWMPFFAPPTPTILEKDEI